MTLPCDAVGRCSEFWRSADLGDRRRSARAAKVAAAMARNPGVPLPQALGSDAAVQGAYRLVNSRHVKFEHLEHVAGEIARQRAEESGGDVLVLHDTTDCAFPDLDPDEVGYLNTGKAGFKLHAALVVDTNGWRRPLGVVSAETLHREEPRKAGRKGASGLATSQWVDKEFDRWWRGISVAEDRLRGCKRVVHVADRESDSYELMAMAQRRGARFVFRVRVVERRGRSIDDGAAGWSNVQAIARALEGRFEREVPLSPRKGKTAPNLVRGKTRSANRPRNARLARLAFAATTVEIPKPRYVSDEFPATLKLHLVHVRELDVPDGEPAVEWLLYTTESIDTQEAVERVVDIYRTRWLSEEFHAALKGGVAFESRGFESAHPLRNLLVLSMPIACEILALRSAAYDDDRPATDVLSPEQIALLRTVSSYKLGPRPTAAEALLAVAALGGHLKRNGPPGWKVVSRGMSDLVQLETAKAREEAAKM
jgi:Transposase DNA-binding